MTIKLNETRQYLADNFLMACCEFQSWTERGWLEPGIIRNAVQLLGEDIDSVTRLRMVERMLAHLAIERGIDFTNRLTTALDILKLALDVITVCEPTDVDFGPAHANMAWRRNQALDLLAREIENISTVVNKKG